MRQLLGLGCKIHGVLAGLTLYTAVARAYCRGRPYPSDEKPPVFCIRQATPKHTHTHIHTHTNTHTHTHTYIYIYTHIHIHINIHTHTPTHTHTRRHTHTRTSPQRLKHSSWLLLHDIYIYIYIYKHILVLFSNFLLEF